MPKEGYLTIVFNAWEFYSTLRREFTRAKCREAVLPLSDWLVEVSISDVIEVVEMKKDLPRLVTYWLPRIYQGKASLG